MGQAQRSEQRNIQYRDVELELWELDEEEYGGRNRQGARGQRVHTSRTENERRRRVNNTSGRSGRSSADSGGNVNRRGEARRIESTGRTDRRAGYRDTEYSVRKNSGRKDGNRARVRNDNLNIMVYEQRQGRGNTRQTRNRAPERELQIQDIRRYQGNGAVRRTSADGVSYGRTRSVQSARRRRSRKTKVYLARTVAVLFVVLCVAVICCMTGQIYKMVREIRQRNDIAVHDVAPAVSEKVVDNDGGIAPPEITEDYLEINDFSRPGTALTKVNSIFVHYTANPGTSAAQNRSYFANLALTQERSASAHLIIGYDGEVIQCIPFDEQAYAVMTRNEDSISIECCYVSEDGSFTQETYDTLVHTLAWLIDKYDLSSEDILRHYDCGGKKCPIYYVENEGAWEQLLRDVENYQ